MVCWDQCCVSAYTPDLQDGNGGTCLQRRWSIAEKRATDDLEVPESLQGMDALPPDNESLAQPRLYMDLRPYLDCAPITVRFALPALSCCRSQHSNQLHRIKMILQDTVTIE